MFYFIIQIGRPLVKGTTTSNAINLLKTTKYVLNNGLVSVLNSLIVFRAFRSEVAK